MLGSRGTFIDLGAREDLAVTAATLQVQGITLRNGRPKENYSAGCLWFSGARLELDDVGLRDCRGTNWGALYATVATAQLEHVVGAGNFGVSRGGALYLEATGAVSLRDVVLFGNEAGPGGGSALGVHAQTVDVDGLVVRDNPGRSGGGIYAPRGVALRDIEIAGNGGQGLGVFGSPISIEDIRLGPSPDRTTQPVLFFQGNVVADIDGLIVDWDDPVDVLGEAIEVDGAYVDLTIRNAYVRNAPIRVWVESWDRAYEDSSVTIEESVFEGDGPRAPFDTRYPGWGALVVELSSAALSGLGVAVTRTNFVGTESALGVFADVEGRPDRFVEIREVEFYRNGWTEVTPVVGGWGLVSLPSHSSLSGVRFSGNVVPDSWAALRPAWSDGSITLDRVDFGTGTDANTGGPDLLGCATERLGYVEHAVITEESPCP
jgi:hypothetical protein